MNHSMPGLPVHHQLTEFTQTHVHHVSDVIQSSHPLSSPYPPAPNPAQNQGLFQWVNSLHEVAKVSASASVLPMNTQDWSLGWTGWSSLQSKGLSRVFSNTTIQKHHFFFDAQLKSKELSFIIISFMARGNSALCMRESLKMEHRVLTLSINRNLEISLIRGRNHFLLTLAWNS